MIEAGRTHIDETIFAEPQERLRGVVVAMMTFKGKPKRVAHATLRTDMPAQVTLDPIRGSLVAADMDAYIDILTQFKMRLNELDREQPGLV